MPAEILALVHSGTRFIDSKTLACVAVLLATLLTGCNGSGNTLSDTETNADEATRADTTPIEITPTETTPDQSTPNETTSEDNPQPQIDWSVLTPHAADITDLILVTGQSNVRGSNTDFDPALDAPNKQAFVFNSTGQWGVSDLHNAWDGNWAPGNGSLQDETRQPHNNFVFHFGKVVAESDSSRVIGYVVLSAPGKGIAHWDRDKEFFYEVRDLALSALNAQGVKSEFDAILWHQGETDWQSHGTSDPQIFGEQRNYPNYYREKLVSLIADFRGQSWVNDNAYFICGETAIAPINEVLMELNYDGDPRTGCVSAHGLTTIDTDPIPIHFDDDGLRELGRRYAELYLRLTE